MGIIVLIVIVSLVYSSNNKVPVTVTDTDVTEEVITDDDAMVKDDTEVMMKKDEGEAMAKSGSYEKYSAEKVAQAETGDIVLFFKASWCPTCKALDFNIKANVSNIPNGLAILEIDYDNSLELRKKYGVTYQHTLVQVDKDGNLIKKWSGSPTLAAIVAEVK